MISKEALEEIKQVSEMYPDGIHKRQEIETFTRWRDPTIEEKDKEIERLNNIIKEVRELAKKQLLSNTNYTKYTDEMCLNDILEILDKENK